MIGPQHSSANRNTNAFVRHPNGAPAAGAQSGGQAEGVHFTVRDLSYFDDHNKRHKKSSAGAEAARARG